MPALSTIIAAAGLGLAAGSAVFQYEAAGDQAKANEELNNRMVTEQQNQEKLRRQQMTLDANRRKREIVRAQMAARQQALAVTTAQGASAPGSSALGGAYGSIGGRTGVNTLGVNQNVEIGEGMFASHSRQADAYRSYASASGAASTMAAFGSGLGSLGGAMISGSGTFGKVGTWVGAQFGGHPTNVGSATSFG